MKKVLILGMHSSWKPYDKIMQVALETWASVEQPGTETIFYCDGNKPNTDKVIYFDVPTDIFSIGKKTLKAFEWALANKDWDYLSRPQCNAYIHKGRLLERVQSLPDTNVFEGL